MLFTLVCSEINLVYASRYTWWIDSGATTHISVSMHGCLWSQQPCDVERFIYVGDGKIVAVEAIGTFKLLWKTDHFLNLEETYVVPSFWWNLVLISIFDKFGYSCSFGSNKISFFQYSNLIGTCSLSLHDNLYLLDTIALFNESLHTSSCGTKRKLRDRNSATL